MGTGVGFHSDSVREASSEIPPVTAMVAVTVALQRSFVLSAKFEIGAVHTCIVMRFSSYHSSIQPVRFSRV